PPACPPHAAEWFTYAHSEMTRRNLGAHFNAVLAAWGRIEAASRFEHSSGAISKQFRPEQVNRWIQCGRGRKGKADTSVPNPAQYERQWWAWWNSLQLGWRGKDLQGDWAVVGPYGKEWEGLLFWGQNGVLSIMASLYFWGCGVQEDEGSLGQWERAVNDVAWVFEGLALFHEAFKKRF
ncbi:hypothetical protein C8F04DRAFT_974155, partial [Mycena alexandri]